MGTGTNLVIQQAGDVSRMQEMMQRSGEMQQASAAQEAHRQEQLKRSQVQKSDNSATGNKVDKDGKQEQQQQAGAHGRKRQASTPDEENAHASGTGGLLDIVV